MELFSFTFWLWVFLAIILWFATTEIKDAVLGRDYKIFGGIILGIVIGSIAIYNTDNFWFRLATADLDNAVICATTITIGWCLICWIYYRIK